jgi:hypothetical protein
MSKEMSDVQVGEYLSCLYLQKPQVNQNKRFSYRIYFILFSSILNVVVN